jgi:hypothetical protein
MVILQKVVPASCSEPCPALTSHDADLVISIKEEEMLATEVGEDLPPVMYPGIKAEHEVSCMSCVSIVQYTEFPVIFLISICPHGTTPLGNGF